MKGLGFESVYVDPILIRDKYRTIRLDSGIEEGDIVEFFDEYGVKFAETSILEVPKMNAYEYVEWDPDGHKSYPSAHFLADMMSIYYPNIDTETEFDVPTWNPEMIC